MEHPTAHRHLTDRDVEILQVLDRCPLTVSQLLKLSATFATQHFTSIRSVQDRLQKMRGVGWIRSWPYAVASRGSPPDYFKLTALGYRLLYGENAELPAKRHLSEVSVGNHHHTLRLSDFIVHTLVGAHRRCVRIVNFYRENSLRLCVDGQTLQPDSAFELHAPDGRQFNFIVELDNGTERIRSNKDTDSWQRKVRLYNTLQDRNYPNRFRVLVLTTRCVGRLQSILAVAAAHATNPQRSLFYAAHLDHYLQEPDALGSPCFQNHHGLRFCLLPSVMSLPTPAAAPTFA